MIARPERTFVVAAVLALAGLAGPDLSARAGDAPLPEFTPAQLAARIRESMARYADRGVLRVVFFDTHDTNYKFHFGGATAEEAKPIMVSFRGRARYEGDGTRWLVEYESKMPRVGSTDLSSDRWMTGFDGERSYEWRRSQDELVLGESSRSAQMWSPRSVIWEKTDTLLQMLDDADQKDSASKITRREVDGRNCYLVEIQGRRDPKWGSEVVISPSQGYLPISRKWTRLGRTYSSHTLQGIHEVAPGLWAPERIEDESISVRNDGASRLFSRRRLQIAEYRPGEVPPRSAFRLVLPYGVDVVDRPLGFAYHNDPWWPEVGAMLKEKFGWPPPDFSALRNVGSAFERNLDGHPAPPFRIASWANTKPVDTAAFRGKVVLVEFGGMWDPRNGALATAFRNLYEVYHPAGLEVLSIHSPEADAEELRRFANAYRLPYPVAIDEGKPGSTGLTAEAFAIRGRTSIALIDRDGKIRSAGDSSRQDRQVVDAIISLLKQPGGADVEAISVATPQLTDEAIRAADRLYTARFKEAINADPSGRISGRVLDDRKQPIGGARSRATPHLTMLMWNSSGGYYSSPIRAPLDHLTATTGADGRFELSGLCKGAYILKVEAPGRAWVERKVYLGPDLPPATAEFVLDQGDTIAGQVRDPDGKPISNAMVAPTKRLHYHDGDKRYTSPSGVDGVRTDENGRFRFVGLQQGGYVLQISAKGYKERELDAISSGDDQVDVNLEPSP